MYPLADGYSSSTDALIKSAQHLLQKHDISLSCSSPVLPLSQVTILALQQIFSRFGKVDKIVMFDKGSGSQALVQMANVHTAMSAHEAADMQVCKLGGL